MEVVDRPCAVDNELHNSSCLPVNRHDSNNVSEPIVCVHFPQDLLTLELLLKMKHYKQNKREPLSFRLRAFKGLLQSKRLIRLN